MSTRATDSRILGIPLVRLFLGGLLGGVVSNVSGLALGALVLHSEARQVLQAMENPPSAKRMLIQHVLMRVGVGLAAAWLYGAIRPRFRRRTLAIVAAATFLWLTTYLFSTLILEELRVYSTRTAIIGAAWGLLELVLVVATVDRVVRDAAGEPPKVAR